MWVCSILTLSVINVHKKMLVTTSREEQYRIDVVDGN